MFQEMKFRLEGVAPLVLHNGQTADPLNEYAVGMKVITSKRKKTEEDYAKLGDLEWEAGLYLNDGEIVLPGDLVEAMVGAGAKATRRGKTALAGVYCENDFVLEYPGSKDLKELRSDPEYRLVVPVRVQRNKVIRTRPLFKNWAVTITLHVNSEMFNEADALEILQHCGENVGLCDWRPKYGRFTVERIN